MDISLDDIVTHQLADELRALVWEYRDHGCYCGDCRSVLAEKCDDVLDVWLERTGRG